MAETKKCPKCGAELPGNAPEGICPTCLMQAGLASEQDAGSGPEMKPTTLTSGFMPPEPEDLAKHFPQLEILELLGKGGMGAVYKARQPGLDRLVAVKILPPEVGADPAFAERFTREARALAKLSHQNIVTVFDSGKADGQYYFIMEYVDGANLRHVIETGAVKPEEALAIVPQICEALEFAHDVGIVHRDIKPENILVDKQGRVKIADFGLAKLLHNAPAEATLTGTHQAMGTLHYMAPEQMQGAGSVDHRADLYSLGVVIYEMLTGQLPIGRFEPPSKRVEIDVRLDEVVLRTLENDPEHRYQRANEIKTDVEEISSNCLQDSSTPGSPSKADRDDVSDDIRRAVRRPTDGIIATAVLSLVPAVLMFRGMLDRLHDAGFSTFIVSVVGSLSLLAIPQGLLMLQSALKMRNVESYGWARLGAFLAMAPITPAWILGLPIGLWVQHVLRQPNIRAAFWQPPRREDANEIKTIKEPERRYQKASEAETQAARDRVMAPAISLTILSSLLILFAVLIGLAAIGVSVWYGSSRRGPVLWYGWWFPSGEELVMWKRLISLALIQIPLLPFGLIMFVGALRMRRLESYGLAMTASYVSALLGGLDLLICGAASSLGVQGIGWAIVLLPGLGIPVGIWCLRVLHNAGVKAAFTAEAPPAQLVVTTLVAVLISLVGIGCAIFLVMRWSLLHS